MRNRSSKQGIKGGGSEMEMEKKEGAHLSGAYIRSLVKQLSSSRTKDPINHKPTVTGDGDDGFPQNFPKLSERLLGETQQPNQPQPQQPQQQQQQQQQQPKKQVRRRLHTSRPYQERLLNMAEARREIVTALKFHRASMKQATEQQHQEPPFQTLETPPQIQFPQPSLEHAEKMKTRRNPRVYQLGDNTNYSNYISYPSSSFPFPPQTQFSWPSSSPIPTSPISTENYNFSLPNQTLGLNLNLHDFNYNNNPSIYSSSSPSSSSSYSPPTAMEEVPPSSAEEPPMMDDGSDSGVRTGDHLLHPAMDDEEMAEIRSIGEKHQIEWNDTMNLMTSAWWFKFLKTMEISPDPESKQDDGFQNPFDEVLEFPSWLNANAYESCFLQQNLEYLQDPALPCMDIGEIDGMDAEWLD
ncbi:putative uncharacterized protein DDB_G0274435 [Telopea speciosissima]|uniref:putative uncharacterized protein DDB_G0274435 n=1 Tax=Telopea speciosissima TaxID=54955 RepID=UPI001CC7E395|nr:putative uncharacterized protein DDB_G0274435 [Telopea speciosissima]